MTVIRQSTVNSMMLCPARYGLREVEGYDPVPSEAMFFGTVVHAMVERELRAIQAGERYQPAARAVADLILDLGEDEGVNLDDLNDHLDALVDEALTALVAWRTEVWMKYPHLHDLESAQMELTLEVPLDADGQYRLNGTPDLVLPDRVVDWKTSGRGWKENNDGFVKGEFEAQAPLYHYLLGRSEGIFEWYVYDRKSIQWVRHATHVTAPQVDAWVATAIQYARMIEHDIYPCTPADSDYGKYARGWHCSASYCSAWNVCDGKNMINDGKELEVALTGRWN